MAVNDDKERQQQSAALENAQRIPGARQHTDEELAHTVAMMRATLEATTDGIVVTDRAGRITNYNGRYLTMWRVPKTLLEERDHRRVLAAISTQFPDPRQFLARVETIYATAPPETFDLLEMSDGRAYERISSIQFVEGHNVGRVWTFRDVTERRQAEVALQEQSAWLRVTLASIGDAVLATDNAGRITFLNPVAQELTGWTAEEAVGLAHEQVFRIVNEQTRQPVEDPVAVVLREGRTVGLANHTMLIARDGSERPIDDSGAPIRNERGAIIGAVLVFRDVTERRRAEESRLHLAAVVESSDDAIVSKGLDSRIRSWNRAAEHLFGYTAAEMIGRSITLIIPPELQHEEAAIIERLRQGEQVGHFETVRLRKDGRRLHVSLSISPIRDASGQIIGASKIARDITERKRSETIIRSLQRVSERLNSTLDVNALLEILVQEALPLVDAESGVAGLATPAGMVARTYCRQGQIQPLEYAWAPGHGLPGWALVHKVPYRTNDAGNDRQIVPELRERFGVQSALSVPILTADKQVLGFFEVHNKLDRAGFTPADEEQLLAVAQTASIAIQNALAYRTVQQTEAALRDSDRRKDEFLATLAHELRNPLAPIRNGLQIMQMAGTNPGVLRSTQEMMERQVQHMVHLIDDLLDLSRVSRGKIQLRKERIELGTLLQNAIETSRPLIQAARHEFTVQLPPNRIWLEADATRIAQVVGNLLNNSAKYTKEGGHIWLTAEQSGHEAVIRVRDNGIGIPPAMLPRIFDMFAQVETALGRSQGGLGIGLTLVKSLVEMHGGKVEAHSAGPDRGSEFIIRLPMATTNLGSARPKRRDTDVPNRPRQARRILVVDDNVDGAQSLGLVLRMLGHSTALAHDGQMALEVAQSYRPDLILLDIGLPGLNGYEVAERLRQLPDFRDVVLVAVTGWGQEEDRRRSKEAGFDHHLTKPADPAVIEQFLKSLSGHGLRSTGERST